MKRVHFSLQPAHAERRIDRMAIGCGLLFALAYGAFLRSWMAPLSVLLGAAAAWVNFRWMSAGISAVVLPANRKKVKRLVLKFLLRLVLIFVVLYVMIRVSVIGLLGVVIGLSVYVAAMMAEAGISLFSASK